MAKVQFDLEGNYEPALNGITRFNKALSETKKSQDEMRDKFKENTTDAEEFGKKATRGIKNQTDSVNDLKKKLQELSAARDRSHNPVAVQRFNKKIDETNAKIKALTTSQKKLGDETQKTNKKLEGTGSFLKNVFSNIPFLGVSQGISNIDSALDKTNQTAQSSSGIFKGLGGTMIALPIAGLVAGLASVSAFFTKTDDGGTMLEGTLGAVSAVVGRLTGNLAELGSMLFDVEEESLSFSETMETVGDVIKDQVLVRLESIGRIGTSIFDILTGDKEALKEVSKASIDFATGIRNSGEATIEFVKEAREAAKAAYEFAFQMDAINDKSRDQSIILSENRLKIVELVRQSKNQSIAIDERIQKLQEANDLDEFGLQQQLAIEEERLQLIKDRNIREEDSINQRRQALIDQLELQKQSASSDEERLKIEEKINKVQQKFLNISDKLKQEEADIQIKINQLKTESVALQERNNAAIAALREQGIQEEIEAAKRRAIRLENDEKERFLRGVINHQEFELRKQKIHEDSLKAQRKILLKHGKDVTEIDKTILDDRIKILEDYNKAVEGLEKTANKARLDSLESEERLKVIRDTELAEIEAVKKTIEDLNVQLGKKRDLTEEQLAQIQLLRDEANRKYLKGELEFQKKEVDLNEQIQIERIKGIKDDSMTEVELEKFKQEEILKVQIEAAKKRLFLLEDDNSKESELQREKIKNFISDAQKQLDELQNQKSKFSLRELLGLSEEEFSAVKSAFTEFKDSILSVYNDFLDEEIKINQRRVSSLDRSISERERAIDREIKLAELGFASNVENQKKQLEEEKKQRDKALKAQEEAQKKKQRLETIEQAVGLATSSVNIFKSLSPLGPIGIALAVATIGAMIAAFISAKSKAAKASKLRKGGLLGDVIEAPSHERGGHKIMTKSGLFEVEGGEMITNRDSTRKHNRLLKALNRDKENEIIEAMIPYINIDEFGIKLNKSRPLRVVKEATSRPSVNYFPGILQKLDGIEANTKNIQDKHIIAVPKDAVIIEYSKNSKRIIKNV